VFPFFFVWNDFNLAGLTAEFRGIKWHRHPDEPVYHYDDPRCRALLAAITERRLPIVLEEGFEETVRFLDELAPQAVVVLPHCGYLNGGFWRLHKLGVWKRPNVYADSSAAPSHDPGVLREFLAAYGPEKLLYGSDYPFDNPGFCLDAIRALGLPPADEALVVAGNALRLIGANGA
jgi:predicted TIM-barrel fold metal-dependent hydrolase